MNNEITYLISEVDILRKGLSSRESVESAVVRIRKHDSSITPTSVITELVDNAGGPNSWGKASQIFIQVLPEKKQIIFADNGKGMTDKSLGNCLLPGHGQGVNHLLYGNDTEITENHGLFGHGLYTSNIKCADSCSVYSRQDVDSNWKQTMIDVSESKKTNMFLQTPVVNARNNDKTDKLIQSFFGDEFKHTGTIFVFNNVHKNIFETLFPDDKSELLENNLRKLYCDDLKNKHFIIKIQYHLRTKMTIINSGIDILKWDETEESRRIEKNVDIYWNDTKQEYILRHKMDDIEYEYTKDTFYRRQRQRVKNYLFDSWKGSRIKTNSDKVAFIGMINIKGTYPPGTLIQKELDFANKHGIPTGAFHGLHIKRNNRLLNLDGGIIIDAYVGAGWIYQHFRLGLEYEASNKMDEAFHLNYIKQINSDSYSNFEPAIKDCLRNMVKHIQKSLESVIDSDRNIRSNFYRYHIRKLYNEYIVPLLFKKNKHIISQKKTMQKWITNYPTSPPVNWNTVSKTYKDNDELKFQVFYTKPKIMCSMQDITQFIIESIIDAKFNIETENTRQRATVFEKRQEKKDLKNFIKEIQTIYHNQQTEFDMDVEKQDAQNNKEKDIEFETEFMNNLLNMEILNNNKEKDTEKEKDTAFQTEFMNNLLNMEIPNNNITEESKKKNIDCQHTDTSDTCKTNKKVKEKDAEFETEFINNLLNMEIPSNNAIGKSQKKNIDLNQYTCIVTDNSRQNKKAKKVKENKESWVNTENHLRVDSFDKNCLNQKNINDSNSNDNSLKRKRERVEKFITSAGAQEHKESLKKPKVFQDQTLQTSLNESKDEKKITLGKCLDFLDFIYKKETKDIILQQTTTWVNKFGEHFVNEQCHDLVKLFKSVYNLE